MSQNKRKSSKNPNTQECKTFSGPKPNKPCVFPFDYKGFTHFDCITVEHDQLWFSTEVHANGGHVDGNWGNCGDECFSGDNLQLISDDNTSLRSRHNPRDPNNADPSLRSRHNPRDPANEDSSLRSRHNPRDPANEDSSLRSRHNPRDPDNQDSSLRSRHNPRDPANADPSLRSRHNPRDPGN